VRSSANMSDMDPLTLAGRAVLITGAARRIGAALARGFHAHGADVCIHCHKSIGEAESLRDELNGKPGRGVLSTSRFRRWCRNSLPNARCRVAAAQGERAARRGDSSSGAMRPR